MKFVEDIPVQESQEPGPLDSVVNEEQEEGLRSILKAISPKHQEVLRLKFQEGFSYRQIAEITGHSVSHVGVLIHNGMPLSSGP